MVWLWRQVQLRTAHRRDTKMMLNSVFCSLDSLPRQVLRSCGVRVDVLRGALAPVWHKQPVCGSGQEVHQRVLCRLVRSSGCLRRSDCWVILERVRSIHYRRTHFLTVVIVLCSLLSSFSWLSSACSNLLFLPYPFPLADPPSAPLCVTLSILPCST